jgi:hypothetical protein
MRRKEGDDGRDPPVSGCGRRALVGRVGPQAELGRGMAGVKTADDGKYTGLGQTFDHWAAQNGQEGGRRFSIFETKDSNKIQTQV